MKPEPRRVACPTCGEPVLWAPDIAWRPFCSERCKMIDLGAWATERYRLPVMEEDDELDSPRGGEPPASQ